MVNATKTGYAQQMLGDVTPDEEFWQSCRKRAAVLNIPAWRIAEEQFQHPENNASKRKI